MGYSYENEMAHQQWLDYAKQASSQKALNAVIVSGNPAAMPLLIALVQHRSAMTKPRVNLHIHITMFTKDKE